MHCAEIIIWLATYPASARDPLILDLDGNGVSLTESVYFDHNANGIANQKWSGYLQLMDCLHDRDGNGTIELVVGNSLETHSLLM
ncbi:hypothetical protein OH492_20525 [Vibrio chagasii]|nr:hypothetical protein [Vibrio chagasii]